MKTTLCLLFLLVVPIISEPITFIISTQEAIVRLDGQSFNNADLVIELSFDTVDIVFDPNNGGILYENSIVTYTSNDLGLESTRGTVSFNLALRISEELTIFTSDGPQDNTAFFDSKLSIGPNITNTNTNTSGTANFDEGFLNYDGVSDLFLAGGSFSEPALEFEDHEATTVNEFVVDDLENGQLLEIDSLTSLRFGSGGSLTFSAQVSTVPEPSFLVLLFVLVTFWNIFKSNKID